MRSQEMVICLGKTLKRVLAIFSYFVSACFRKTDQFSGNVTSLVGTEFLILTHSIYTTVVHAFKFKMYCQNISIILNQGK